MLKDSEDHELRRTYWGDADFRDETSVEDVVLRHRRAIDGDEERFLFGAPNSAPLPPLATQEQTDRVFHARPEPIVIGLEHHPLGALVDRSLEEDEEPADLDVLPQRVR